MNPQPVLLAAQNLQSQQIELCKSGTICPNDGGNMSIVLMTEDNFGPSSTQYTVLYCTGKKTVSRNFSVGAGIGVFSDELHT